MGELHDAGDVGFGACLCTMGQPANLAFMDMNADRAGWSSIRMIVRASARATWATRPMVTSAGGGYRRPIVYATGGRMLQHHHHEDGQTSIEYALTLALAIALVIGLAAATSPAGDFIAGVIASVASAL
jgi:Flp pilus assembly pilin Flp